MADKRLAYDIVTRRLTAGMKTCARFTCTVCAREEFKTMPPSGNNHEMICQWFERDGWRVSMNNRRKVRCPEHAGKGHRRRAPRKEGSAMGATAATPTKDTISATGLAAQAATAVTARPAPLTNEQRGRIRALLDKHFDDAVGRYIDGYTDQRVGEQLGIPWASVKQVREAAYGELRGDPELDALRRMIDGAQQNATTLKGALEKVQAEIGLAQARLDTIERRVGIKA